MDQAGGRRGVDFDFEGYAMRLSDQERLLHKGNVAWTLRHFAIDRIVLRTSDVPVLISARRVKAWLRGGAEGQRWMFVRIDSDLLDGVECSIVAVHSSVPYRWL